MQTKAEQLLSQLKSRPLPLVWISGDEALLVQETCDQVRHFAKENGYTERIVLDVTPGFDWNALLEQSNSLSLFAEKMLIDLRLPTGKLDNDAKSALKSYLENPSPDNLLMLTSGKIEKASLNTKWFKAIESHAHFTQIWPINAQQLPGWIKQRLKKQGLSANSEAIGVLIQRVEGNLLAAAQEIEKLSLLISQAELSTELDAQTIARAVADSSRFSVFTLIDACLAGNSARALKILYNLQAEGTESLQILNLLCRETRNLSRMRSAIDKGQNINGVMQSERVWSNRTALVSNALENHSVSSLQNILEQALLVDQSVKGLRNHNPWDELAGIVLKLCNTQTVLSKTA